MNRFKGKTVWITGAETPIGRKSAQAFYDEGADILLSGIDSTEITPKAGQNIFLYKNNPLTRDDAENALSLCENIDALVSAMRKIEKCSVLECTPEKFEDIIDANLTSVFIATRAAAMKMGKTRGGAMVVVSSIHGEKPTGSAFLYSVSNGGLNMLVKEAAQDFGRLGIRINMFRTGPMEGETDILQSEFSGLYHEPEKRVPRGKISTADEFCEPILFLASDGASFINGATLTADGGFLGYYYDGDSERRWDNGRFQ